MSEIIFYLDTNIIVDYLTKDNTQKVIEFFKKAEKQNIELYTSEWTIYEAIPILIQEEYWKNLENAHMAFTRIRKKITRETVPSNIREKLIPKIKSLHKMVKIIGFNELPSEVHENAQKMALKTTFSSFDSLHIAIAQYLSEYCGKEGKTIKCYLVSNDTSDFNLRMFGTLNTSGFAGNTSPITPEDAIQVLEELARHLNG